MNYRYLVVSAPEPSIAPRVFLRTNDKQVLEKYVQDNVASEIQVYQLKYVAENVLCEVAYEDDLESQKDVESL